LTVAEVSLQQWEFLATWLHNPPKTNFSMAKRLVPFFMHPSPISKTELTSLRETHLMNIPQ
jgi:hypothetical protein